MSTRKERGGLLTSMYQLLQPPWMSMSRTIDLGGAGGVVAADVEQAQDRLGAVPLLAEGGLGPLDGLAGQLPVGVQPVGIADHDDDAVLAVAGRQVLGHLGGQVLGGHADVVLAALDCFFAAEPLEVLRAAAGCGRARCLVLPLEVT